jgi:AcrR family transcriptional regulator
MPDIGKMPVKSMPSRGRPRAFDRDAALAAAMRVFWRRGYDGASMAELTAEMGINAPSLYAAFGSKEELFQEALRLYLETEDCEGRNKLFGAATAREGFQAMLRHSAHAVTRPNLPHGCLLLLGDANSSAQNVGVHASLCNWRRDIQAVFEQRLRQGIAAGDVPAHADVAAVAAFYLTVLQGLSLQARDGATRGTLTQIADSAVAGWDALVAASAPTASKRPAKTGKRS